MLESVLREDSSLRLAYPTLAMCYLASDQRKEAEAMITEDMLSFADADGEMAYRLATYFALDGDATEALYWLRKTIYLGNENYPWFASNPAWSKLTANEDLVKVLARLKKTHRQNELRWKQLRAQSPRPDHAPEAFLSKISKPWLRTGTADRRLLVSCGSPSSSCISRFLIEKTGRIEQPVPIQQSVLSLTAAPEAKGSSRSGPSAEHSD